MVCSTGGSGACFARRIILTHLRLRAFQRGSGRIICREPESPWSNPKALKTPSRSEVRCFFAGVHGQHAHGRIWGWLIADVETQA